MFGNVQLKPLRTGAVDMTEPHDLPAGGESHRRWRAGTITRAAAAVAMGVTMGWATRDVGIGITTTTATMNILREVFVRPQR